MGKLEETFPNSGSNWFTLVTRYDVARFDLFPAKVCRSIKARTRICFLRLRLNKNNIIHDVMFALARPGVLVVVLIDFTFLSKINKFTT